MTTASDVPNRVITNAMQTESKNRWPSFREKEKEKDLPIICTKETTLAYQKAEAAGLSQRPSPGG